MGFEETLNSAGGSKQFVTVKRFEETIDKQQQAVPEILERLRQLEDSPSEFLRLEFFFYTNSAGKAKEFSDCLKKRNYSVEYGKSRGTSDLFLITGWTSKMPVTDESITAWSKEMCELGYEYDCDFDGWGTTPDQ
jgi:hypothetical protein